MHYRYTSISLLFNILNKKLEFYCFSNVKGPQRLRSLQAASPGGHHAAELEVSVHLKELK